MGTLTLLVLAALGTWQMAEGGNLLRNPGFEEPVVGTDWKGYGFEMTRTRDDASNGTFSLLCRQRYGAPSPSSAGKGQATPPPYPHSSTGKGQGHPLPHLLTKVRAPPSFLYRQRSGPTPPCSADKGQATLHPSSADKGHATPTPLQRSGPPPPSSADKGQAIPPSPLQRSGPPHPLLCRQSCWQRSRPPPQPPLLLAKVRATPPPHPPTEKAKVNHMPISPPSPVLSQHHHYHLLVLGVVVKLVSTLGPTSFQ